MHGRASERWDYKWRLKIDMLNHVECHSTWYIRVLNLHNLAYPTMYVSEFSVQETIHTVSSDKADLTHADRSHLDFLEIWAWTKDCHRIVDGYPGETWDTFITGPKTGHQVLCILVESDKKMQTFSPWFMEPGIQCICLQYKCCHHWVRVKSIWVIERVLPTCSRQNDAQSGLSSTKARREEPG